jgi:hypothetical protein
MSQFISLRILASLARERARETSNGERPDEPSSVEAVEARAPVLLPLPLPNDGREPEHERAD